MSVILKGGASGTLADVDANNNLKTTLPLTLAQAGFAKIAGGDGLAVTTSGAFSGAPTAGAVKNRLKAGLDSVLFYDPIDGAAVNDNVWQRSITTAFTALTATISGSLMVLNGGSSTAASSSICVFTAKQFQRVTTFPLVARWVMKVPNRSVTNVISEIGFGTWASQATNSTSTPVDGAFFRFTSGGLFAVTTFNSSETVSAVLTDPGAAANTYMIVRKASGVDFYVNDVLAITVSSFGTTPAATSVSRVPFFGRVNITSGGAASAVPTLQIGEIIVFQEDLNNSKKWGDQLMASGRSLVQGQPASAAFTQLANYANSAAPASATLSNTAAGYTTLGGQWQFVPVAGAETDYCLFGFQVPAGNTMYVSAINISSFVMTALGGAMVLQWALAVNSTAVSLATADTAAAAGTAQSVSPRRETVGVQALPVTVGTAATPLVATFDPPLVCEGGRFFQIILKTPVATVTTGLTRGTVGVNGYFE
jgi:hypothetical protein